MFHSILNRSLGVPEEGKGKLESELTDGKGGRRGVDLTFSEEPLGYSRHSPGKKIINFLGPPGPPRDPPGGAMGPQGPSLGLPRGAMGPMVPPWDPRGLP